MVGVQFRDVFCFREQDLTVVDNSLCGSQAQPTTALSVCNTQKCTKPNWMADANWGPCALGADGINVRTRTFHCHNADGTNAVYSVCTNGAGPLPIAVLPCTPGTCSDSNGCPNVQIGDVFARCGTGIRPCSTDCAGVTQTLSDELTALSMKGSVAATCAQTLANELPVAYQPSASLLSAITSALNSGQTNICQGGGVSASSYVIVSWGVLIALLLVGA